MSARAPILTNSPLQPWERLKLPEVAWPSPALRNALCRAGVWMTLGQLADATPKTIKQIALLDDAEMRAVTAVIERAMAGLDVCRPRLDGRAK